ncbi:hypothetical protein HK097_003202 [Rhizophlyctis rosea]|uniref:P-loop containing nucleoside triphosphate hydrolase protein n=1 Tax=Rhizophlyctis rosea TaxID=64517 RepID=A0AAD5SIC8_9FUNG|nr:hypothetical protein HK097_003202 [Rhizophlyctis rosea]
MYVILVALLPSLYLTFLYISYLLRPHYSALCSRISSFSPYSLFQTNTSYLPISTDRPDPLEDDNTNVVHVENEGTNNVGGIKERNVLADRVALGLVGLHIIVTVVDLVVDVLTEGKGTGVMKSFAAAIWALQWLAISVVLVHIAFPPSDQPIINPWYLTYLDGYYILAILVKLIEGYALYHSKAGNARFILVLLQAILASGPLTIDLYQRYWMDDGVVPPSRNVDVDGREPSHEITAPLWSRLTFSWMADMINLGNKRPLEANDLWDLLDIDTAATASGLYEYAKLHSNSLPLRLLHTIRPVFYRQIFFAVISALLVSSSPIFVYNILSTIEQKKEARSTAFIWVCGLFVVAVLRSVCEGQMFYNGRRSATRVSSAIIHEVYKKSLRRVQAAQSSGDEKEVAAASVGKIVTLMSVDTERLRQCIAYLHDPLVVTPLRIIFAVSTLVWVLGVPGFAGVAAMLITIPLTALVARWATKVQERLMESTDARVTIMNEVLNGIRIVKYLAWEPQFLDRIRKARNKELRNLVSYYLTECVNNVIWSCTPLLVAFVTFTTFTLASGKPLTPTTAFTGLLLLNALRVPLVAFPNEIMQLFMARVSIKRVERFLEEDELERFEEGATTLRVAGKDAVVETLWEDGEDKPFVGFKDGWFTYFEGKKEEEKNNGKDKKEDEPTSETSERNDESEHEESDRLLGGVDADVTGGDVGDLITGPRFTLRNLNVDFPIGGLSVICGPTGSGKTSLVLALLGEMKRLQGHFSLTGLDRTLDPPRSYTSTSTSHLHAHADGVAYVAQTAWLMNGTIKENILFGRIEDSPRYNAVLNACALTRDLATLPGGDLTEIGEKGINLSGGQKQRISLARAAYSDENIVIMDDPLSAVDAPTAKHLFKECILGLMKGRTRVLVSHSIGLVAGRADLICAMNDGEITAKGSAREVARAFEEGGKEGDREIVAALLASAEAREGSSSEDEESEKEKEKKEKGVGEGTKLVEEEGMAQGAVGWGIYWTYFKAAGGWTFLAAFVGFQVGCLIVTLGHDYWLKRWSDNAGGTNASGFGVLADNGSINFDALMRTWMQFPILIYNRFTTSLYTSTASATAESHSTTYYVTIYGLIGLASIIAQQITYLLEAYGAYHASKRLHDSLLRRVIAAPVRFFDTTPLGRIVNRFSKDIGTIDSELIWMVAFFVMMLLGAFVTMFVVGFVTPLFLLAIAPIAVVYFIVANRYLNCSRELKRLDSVSRSPIYSLFSETLAGCATIRAYGDEERFMIDNRKRIDANHRAFWYLWGSNRWLAFRIDFVAAVAVFCVGIALLVGDADAGWAGLSFSYAMEFTDALLWVVRVHASMEMSMNSVERVKEYLQIEQEPPAVMEDRRPPANWPSRGEIKVDSLTVRYSPNTPPVLNNLNFTFPAQSKIGVVGRTGAGKTTLSLALFRILPEMEGSITIDGIDISSIGLRDLRTTLTIIPQDPVLFSGTLRSNLDPFNERQDLELWDALRSVHFLESLQRGSTTNPSPTDSASETLVDRPPPVTSPETGFDCSDSQPGAPPITLELQISENGSNLSQGQRQLVCLARALLRRSKVVVLDEATASVDGATDGRIQKTIREVFEGCTVVCIAHRLRTVIDYDKILVLDHGQVVEFDTPKNLMDIEGGWFRKMCEETGEWAELLELAGRK